MVGVEQVGAGEVSLDLDGSDPEGTGVERPVRATGLCDSNPAGNRPVLEDGPCGLTARGFRVRACFCRERAVP